MPYNPAGLFSLVASYFATAGATIRTEQHNPVFEDVASALSSVYLRDGRAPMTGPLNMNGQPINNVAVGNSPSSVATLAQAMPIGALIDFCGSTAPSGWALCYGQAISRVTFATLFTLIGTTYGVGDGSTTFNLPDLRGRTVAGKDDMGGAAAGRLTAPYFGTAATALGASGGGENWILSIPQLPVVTPTGVISVAGNTSVPTVFASNTYAASVTASPTSVQGFSFGTTDAGLTVTAAAFGGNPFGGGQPHRTIQPTILLNKIIRVSYDG